MKSQRQSTATLAAMFGVQDAARVGIVMGISTVIFGMLCLLAPTISGMSVNVIVAVVLVAAGFARLVFAFKAESLGQGVLVFLFGGLSVAAGVFMFFSPMVGLSALTVGLAAYFAVDAVIEIIAAFKSRPTDGWGWMLVSGIASGMLAVLIMASLPASTLWAVGTLVGVRLLFAGSSMIFMGSLGDEVTQSVIDEAKQGDEQVAAS